MRATDDLRSSSPSPLAGEGLGRGDGGDSRQKTLAEVQERRAFLLASAKYMRSNPTDAEVRLWSLLRAKRLDGLKWKHQVVFDDRHIADFVCFAHHLIVEADGGQHSESAGDIGRDAWFARQGFRTLRFWNNDVLVNPDGVASVILAACDFSCAADAAHPLSQPSPARGEGSS